MSKDKKASDQRYKGNGKHEWEHATYNTYRLRVPGGWLYRYEIPGLTRYVEAEPRGSALGYAQAVTDAPTLSIAFVPMPEVVKHKV